MSLQMEAVRVPEKLLLELTPNEATMLRLVLQRTRAEGPDAARVLVGLADKLGPEPEPTK